MEIDEALAREGRARDIVRVVQQARREADLQVSDRIHVVLELRDEWHAAASHFRNYIAGQTLARELDLDSPVVRDGYFIHEARLGSESIRIALAKVA